MYEEDMDGLDEDAAGGGGGGAAGGKSRASPRQSFRVQSASPSTFRFFCFVKAVELQDNQSLSYDCFHVWVVIAVIVHMHLLLAKCLFSILHLPMRSELLYGPARSPKILGK